MNYPSRVELTDVCLRDGLQSLSSVVPIEVKFELAKKLIACGFTSLEICSFVSPKWVPQMADAALLAEKLTNYCVGKDVQLTALVPNLKGMENAVAAGIRNVSYVISVSHAHNLSNVNRTPEESFLQLKELMAHAPADVNVCLSLATSFGCPFNKKV